MDKGIAVRRKSCLTVRNRKKHLIFRVKALVLVFGNGCRFRVAKCRQVEKEVLTYFI